MKRKTTRNIKKDLSRCPYCKTKGKGIDRIKPAGLLGIYCKCKTCGAVGGLDRWKTGEYEGQIYLFWTEGAYSYLREEQEPEDQEAGNIIPLKEGAITI